MWGLANLFSPETIFMLDAIEWLKYLVGSCFFCLGLFLGWWQWHYRRLLAEVSAATVVDSLLVSRTPRQEEPAQEGLAQEKSEPLDFISASAPEDSDNLELIRGIGRALKVELNELGICQFRQIASWKEPEIAAMAAKLHLGQQIDRFQWVEQAKQLEQLKRISESGLS